MSRVTGVKQHLARLDRIIRKVPADADKALLAGGRRIAKTTRDSILAGAVSGPAHVPSKPGEPPNADTHVLDRSIHTDRVAPYKVDMIEDAPYSVALEYGTLKMAARPHVRPAVQRERAAVIAGVVVAVNKGVA
ncbi:hypothetical protein [Inquilinus sp.]|uniref:hypothetical protein n=1 Tax=Inquilinus sp. TaxID=1932117 RepID=UPI0031E0BF6A